MNPVVDSGPGVPLISERLTLREFVSADDQPAVHAYGSDPVVTRFLVWGRPLGCPRTSDRVVRPLAVSRCDLDAAMAGFGLFPGPYPVGRRRRTA